MLRLFFCTFVFMMLFIPLSDAQEPRTKENYIQACQQNRANTEAYCACHLDMVTELFRANNTTQWTKEKNKAENARQGILKRLSRYPQVTEHNLRSVCNTTSGFWNTLKELQALSKYKTAEAMARKQTLGNALTAEKSKADNMFLSYKKAHGMITVSNGHTFDDYGKWVSTDQYTSYCIPLNQLDTLNKKINGSSDVPRFNATAINRSPHKEKCFALRKSTPSVPQHLKSADTKNDEYIKRCLIDRNSNKSSNYCACRLEVATDIARTNNQQATNRLYAKQEYYLDIVLKQLAAYNGVTEAGLQKLCEKTHDYWGVRTELFSIPNRAKTAQESAKANELHGVLKTKEKAVDVIFDAYKKAHSIDNRREAGNILSSHIHVSYCAHVSEMNLLKKKMNQAVDIAPYKPNRIQPEARKCDALK